MSSRPYPATRSRQTFTIGASEGWPHRAHLGEIAGSQIRSNSPVAHSVIHLDVIDSDGGTLAHCSGNLRAAGAVTSKSLPLALNDKTGVRKLRATDLPSGGTATAELQVEP